MPFTAMIGGLWLSLLYSAAVMPATVWVVQLTVTAGWRTALKAALGLSLGQLPWCLAAALVLFEVPMVAQALDTGLRVLAVVLLVWMAFRNIRAGMVHSLHLDGAVAGHSLFRTAFWRSLSMPWRLPLWICLIVSVGVHLRGPGWPAAAPFTMGALLGQMLWLGHFILVAGLFGLRVPEPICLHSLNKLRLLGSLVLGGLALIILAPLAFPPI